MPQKPRRLFTFGPFCLDAGDRILIRDGERVPLTPKAVDLLLILIEHQGHVVEKDELMRLVWPDSHVEETNLSHHISILRSTLGDGGGFGPFIETLPRRGYRFVAPILAEGDGLPTGAHSIRPQPSGRRSYLLAGAAVLLAVLATLITLRGTPAAKSNDALVITRLTSDSGVTVNPVISRDGTMVAYASDRSGEDNLDIWVQQTAGGPPIRLTTNPADEFQPDFSPDGSKIVYRSGRAGGGIYVTATLAGGERLVVSGKYAFSPRFSPDGMWIAYSVGTSVGHCKIYVVSSTGGAPRELRTHVPWGKGPIWSPDGKSLMFLGSPDPLGFDNYDWWVARADGGHAVQTGAFDNFRQNHLGTTFEGNRVRGQDERYAAMLSPSFWSADNQVIFSSNIGDSTNLWEAAVDPSTWKIQKPPRRLTTGSGRECNASLADDGRMVFASVHQNLNLWTLPVDANTGKVMGKAEALTRSDANSLRPSLSLDGRKLVFVSDRSGNSDIWFYDMETGKERALASTPWEDSHPYFTPDGSKIFYLTLEPSKQVINVLPLDTGVSERFCDDCGLPMAWSPDGKRIYFHRRDTAAGHWKSIDVVSRELANVFRHPKVYLGTLRISFDGKWLAGYLPTGPTEGRAPILVAPIRSSFVGESEWIEVTDGSGLDSTPWWSPDGGTLYFLSQRDGFVCIFTQSLDKVTKRPVGKPRAIAHFHGVQHTLRRVGFGPGVARDKLVFTMSETNANIWMTTIRSRE